jgi:hypothetical protein
MRTVNTPVLVLNSSYEPVSVATAKRALKMWAKGIARIEEVYDHPFYPGMQLPAVVRLVNYRHVPVRKHRINRRNILLRDRHTCQYCRQKMAPGKLTLDHVFPRARGGQSTWENLVAACNPCNSRKGSKTPEEAGMIPMAMPKALGLHTSRALMRTMAADEELWKRYLYF